MAQGLQDNNSTYLKLCKKPGKIPSFLINCLLHISCTMSNFYDANFAWEE